MRTTLAIDDELLAAAKRRARDRGTTVGSVVEDALRRALAAHEAATPPAVPVFERGTGLRPGVDVDSAAAVHELLDERDLERLR